MKVALKVAYIGTDFYGSQAQPGLRTVEGELRKALAASGAIGPKAKLAFAGRTDAGVHALGQVVAFSPEDEKLAAPRIVNAGLPPDLWAYARASVPDDFDPRRGARSRAYRYILPAPGISERRLREFAPLLLGTHDFANFCSAVPGKGTVRRIERLEVARRGDFYAIDVEADAFLWNMVRKIVTALRLVGENKRPNGWLEKMLGAGYREGIPPAPAEGLYLASVKYEGIAWEEDEYARARARQRLERSYAWHATMAEICSELRGALGPDQL